MGVAAAVDGVEWWACHAPANGRMKLLVAAPRVAAVALVACAESSESILIRRPSLFFCDMPSMCMAAPC